jgi:hypothetical protein
MGGIMTDSNKEFNIVKQQITAKSRKLKASWIVDIDTEIVNLMSQDIQYEIDWQVLCDIDPNRKNWIELDFSETAKEAGRDVIEAWCKETFKHGYFMFSNRVMFLREQDAEFFLLRWS